MRQVTYTDPDGRKKMVFLPEEAPESEANKGIPIGPPSLALLGLPIEIEVRLNNELFNRGIITQKDALRSREQITRAVQSVLKVDANNILMQYLGEDYKIAKSERPQVLSPIATRPASNNSRNSRRRT